MKVATVCMELNAYVHYCCCLLHAIIFKLNHVISLCTNNEIDRAKHEIFLLFKILLNTYLFFVTRLYRLLTVGLKSKVSTEIRFWIRTDGRRSEAGVGAYFIFGAFGDP